MDDRSETLRWFLYPKEALFFLQRSAEDAAAATYGGKAAAPYVVPTDAASTASCACLSPLEANGNATAAALVVENDIVVAPQGQTREETKVAALRREVASLQAEVQALRASKAASATETPLGVPASSTAQTIGAPLACPLRVKRPRGRNKRKEGDGPRFHMPPKNILGPTMRALLQFDMIKNGDRLLIGVSGGKDSLTLLHVIKQVQYVYRAKGIHFDFAAATVDPGTEAYDPSPLKKCVRVACGGAEREEEEEGCFIQASCPRLTPLCCMLSLPLSLAFQIHGGVGHPLFLRIAVHH
jgi:hypothetical protein